MRIELMGTFPPHHLVNSWHHLDHSTAVPCSSGYTGRMTTTDDPTLRSPCPPWCESSHEDGNVEPESHHGLRWSPVRADDGYWVDIPTLQNKNGDVVVWVTALDG